MAGRSIGGIVWDFPKLQWREESEGRFVADFEGEGAEFVSRGPLRFVVRREGDAYTVEDSCADLAGWAQPAEPFRDLSSACIFCEQVSDDIWAEWLAFEKQ